MGEQEKDFDAEALLNSISGLKHVIEWYIEQHKIPVDQVIRVGDTVRIKENYMIPEERGATFTVTGVVFDDTLIANTGSDFYVLGDRRGYGVWEKHIEKVVDTRGAEK